QQTGRPPTTGGSRLGSCLRCKPCRCSLRCCSASTRSGPQTMPDEASESLPPWVAERIERLRADREHGASHLSREAARLLCELARAEADAPHQRRLLHACAVQLTRLRPSMAALANTAARIWYAGEEAGEARQALRRMREEANRVTRGWNRACDL